MRGKKRLGMVAVALTALLAVPAALARPQVLQPALGCLKTAQTTAAMNDCVGKAYSTAKSELADAYAKALAGKGLAPGDKRLLAAAEAKWIVFRDADCSYAASLNAGGTLSAVVQGICLVRDTVDRANALQDYLTTA